MGFPGGASGKEPTRQCRRHKRPGQDPWLGNIPWWATVHRVAKSYLIIAANPSPKLIFLDSDNLQFKKDFLLLPHIKQWNEKELALKKKKIPVIKRRSRESQQPLVSSFHQLSWDWDQAGLLPWGAFAFFRLWFVLRRASLEEPASWVWSRCGHTEPCFQELPHPSWNVFLSSLEILNSIFEH